MRKQNELIVLTIMGFLLFGNICYGNAQDPTPPEPEPDTGVNYTMTYRNPTLLPPQEIETESGAIQMVIPEVYGNDFSFIIEITTLRDSEDNSYTTIQNLTVVIKYYDNIEPIESEDTYHQELMYSEDHIDEQYEYTKTVEYYVNTPILLDSLVMVQVIIGFETDQDDYFAYGEKEGADQWTWMGCTEDDSYGCFTSGVSSNSILIIVFVVIGIGVVILVLFRKPNFPPYCQTQMFANDQCRRIYFDQFKILPENDPQFPYRRLKFK